MNTFRVIDKETWERRELYDFYTGFDNPSFHVSVSLEGDRLHAYAKERGESFFLLALYAILRAANTVPQVRQRAQGEDIIEFERIAVMTPIMTEREMFSQIWCEYAPAFDEFSAQATPKVTAAKKNAPASMEGRGDDYLVASCLPWLHFTSITQANLSFHQAVPILAWGRLKNGLIPFSCKFNHAFLDGLHVSRFFASIEESFTTPESLDKNCPIPA